VSKAIVLPAAALILIFVVVTAIASVAGAKNLGTAATFGQVAFGVGLVAFVLRAPRP
jgi:hypothetical protein